LCNGYENYIQQLGDKYLFRSATIPNDETIRTMKKFMKNELRTANEINLSFSKLDLKFESIFPFSAAFKRFHEVGD